MKSNNITTELGENLATLIQFYIEHELKRTERQIQENSSDKDYETYCRGYAYAFSEVIKDLKSLLLDNEPCWNFKE